MPDETFLPETELRAYSYRGAYGQPVAGPWSNSMNPGVGAMTGMGAGPTVGEVMPMSLLTLALSGFGLYAGVQAMAAHQDRKPTTGWALAALASFAGAFYAQGRLPS